MLVAILFGVRKFLVETCNVLNSGTYGPLAASNAPRQISDGLLCNLASSRLGVQGILELHLSIVCGSLQLLHDLFPFHLCLEELGAKTLCLHSGRANTLLQVFNLVVGLVEQGFGLLPLLTLRIKVLVSICELGLKLFQFFLQILNLILLSIYPILLLLEKFLGLVVTFELCG